MCLSTGAAFLGPADAVLDLAGRRLLFSPGLTDTERVLLARRVLAAAGQEQPSGPSSEVVCICGFDLDLSMPGLAHQGKVVRLALAGRDAAADKSEDALPRPSLARGKRLLRPRCLLAAMAAGNIIAGGSLILLMPSGRPAGVFPVPTSPPSVSAPAIPHLRRQRPRPVPARVRPPADVDASAAAPHAQDQDDDTGMPGKTRRPESGRVTVPEWPAIARLRSGGRAGSCRPCNAWVPCRCSSSSRWPSVLRRASQPAAGCSATRARRRSPGTPVLAQLLHTVEV